VSHDEGTVKIGQRLTKLQATELWHFLTHCSLLSVFFRATL